MKLKEIVKRICPVFIWNILRKLKISIKELILISNYKATQHSYKGILGKQRKQIYNVGGGNKSGLLRCI